METFKPNHPSRGRSALLATACLVLPLLTAQARDANGLANSELSKRSNAIQEAQVLLKQGDEAYTLGNYADAVTAYASARSLIPDAPISAELRDAATQRFAQASVEYARGLVRAGDLAGAKTAVDKVLAPAVAPTNPAALDYRNQLDDPIRTNPALTKEHGQDIDQVRRLLYTAEGAYNLGKFDQAESTYEAVIRIDPTNTAARRGMERIAQTKSGYAKSAYDQTRAAMLAEVASAWETAVPPLDVDPSLTNPGFSEITGDLIPVRNKIDRIVIPKFQIEQATLGEAIDLLRMRATENDTLEIDPALRGVNITVSLGGNDSPDAARLRDFRFDLQLSQLPVSQILKYITEVSGTTFSTDDFAVNIVPAGSTSTALVTRTYRVPPDFVSSITSASAPTAAEEDPFGEASTGRLLAARLGAQEALAAQGVSFPEGTSAKLIAGSLRVVNTEQNQAYISQIIETATNAEPVIVSVTVTMMKVQENRLEELGFDWLLDNFGFGGSSWIPGQSQLNLTGGTVGNGRPLDDIELPPFSSTRNSITAGNRSGDYAVSGDSIDGVLLNSGGRQVSNSAPGVLAVRGEISNATVVALMRGLNQSNGVDLVARPAVVTRSGQSSTVTMVREFPYPTEYEPPELPNSTGGDFGGGGGNTPVTPATPTAFETENVGITMQVLPVVDENKQYINLTLNPVFKEFDGFVNYGSPINSTQTGLFGPETVELTENAILQPIFSKKEINTSVDVLSGATLVLGGLIQDNNQNVEDQVPILGSIPIIGRLFQSKVTQKTSTAIIFLVKVEVMDPTGRSYKSR
jgi:general secretion pathway protein D